MAANPNDADAEMRRQRARRAHQLAMAHQRNAMERAARVHVLDGPPPPPPAVVAPVPVRPGFQVFDSFLSESTRTHRKPALASYEDFEDDVVVVDVVVPNREQRQAQMMARFQARQRERAALEAVLPPHLRVGLIPPGARDVEEILDRIGMVRHMLGQTVNNRRRAEERLRNQPELQAMAHHVDRLQNYRRDEFVFNQELVALTRELNAARAEERRRRAAPAAPPAPPPAPAAPILAAPFVIPDLERQGWVRVPEEQLEADAIVVPILQMRQRPPMPIEPAEMGLPRQRRFRNMEEQMRRMRRYYRQGRRNQERFARNPTNVITLDDEPTQDIPVIDLEEQERMLAGNGMLNFKVDFQIAVKSDVQMPPFVDTGDMGQLIIPEFGSDYLGWTVAQVREWAAKFLHRPANLDRITQLQIDGRKLHKVADKSINNSVLQLPEATYRDVQENAAALRNHFFGYTPEEQTEAQEMEVQRHELFMRRWFGGGVDDEPHGFFHQGQPEEAVRQPQPQQQN